MSEEDCTGSDSLSVIEGKIEKVRKQIEESTGGKNRKHLNKVEKLHQKLRYLEYYRDNAVIPVRGERHTFELFSISNIILLQRHQKRWIRGNGENKGRSHGAGDATLRWICDQVHHVKSAREKQDEG